MALRAMESILSGLLREAEAALAGLHGQRADLDRAERLAAEKVTHLRALVELEGNTPHASTDEAPAIEAVSLPERPAHRANRNLTLVTSAPKSDMRPEDMAADVLSERGPLHYRELWDEVTRRGAVIVSRNPAAVLLTRISRDDRFAKAKRRGVYRLTVKDELARPTPKRHRRKARRRTKSVTPAAAQ